MPRPFLALVQCADVAVGPIVGDAIALGPLHHPV
jgi:hypothetical protein